LATRPVVHAMPSTTGSSITAWSSAGYPAQAKRRTPGGWSATGEAKPEYSLPGILQPHPQSIREGRLGGDCVERTHRQAPDGGSPYPSWSVA
jgi:hypothetical protein